jgi:hypothetical protein
MPRRREAGGDAADEGHDTEKHVNPDVRHEIGSGGRLDHRAEYRDRPVRDRQADDRGDRCSILHLVLGPIDLDLLGLVVHLNRVVLDITAQPGPGNLLGNLLRAIAGLVGCAIANRHSGGRHQRLAPHPQLT